MYKLYGRPGWGSALVEAQLVWYGLDYTMEELDDLFASAAARDKLAPVNPLAQVPTLILPDGTIMTESAAITLLLADQTTRRLLVPSPGHPTRPAFLRWLVFLVTNVYPTFTYVDDPKRFVADPTAAEAFRVSVEAYKERLWHQVDAAAKAPWFLGQNFSALDIFIGVMTHWKPRRAWFAGACPSLTAIATAADALPEFSELWRRNFPGG
jgi:GST-like protein